MKKSEVIQILVDKDNDKIISILPIVGLGGIGKTTLAQIVYHNDRIEKHFKPRMWVCVGEIFNEEVILDKMIEQAGEQRSFSSLEAKSSYLRQQLEKKIFLLVLDDLWNEDESEWEKLKPLFEVAELGSKIIVTTRSERVASITGTIVPPYRLQGLGFDDCWALFKQKAFGLGRQEETPMLVDIGKEIVKKCGGLPLAAKILGSLMGSKTGEAAWLAVRDSEIWRLPKDDVKILPILKLSYDHLPAHLKRCFTYCSMFPKDHEFKIKRLIQLWMAEGLIDTSDNSPNAEDIGYEYFDNLLWRSFFQDVQMDKYNNPVSCKMHELVHDLACSITKDEALVMKGDTKSISHGCRYLSIGHPYGLSIVLKTTYEAKKLRSLILLGRLEYSIVDEFMFNVTETFTRLRVVDLSWQGLQKLSDRISRLKHLRFINLSNAKITTLPTSITRLYNLQTLNLEKCDMLEELPEGMGNLCSLRYMDISSCIKIRMLPTSVTSLGELQTLKLKSCYLIRELPEGISNLCNLRHLDITDCYNLDCIPRGLGRLSNLETLPLFIVAQENGRTIAELEHLNSIRGSLIIDNLRHVTDPDEAMQANLSAKTRLNYLRLGWRKVLSGRSSTEVQVEEGVFERLQPHHNLRELHIRDYMGARLPSWMSSSFPDLVELTMWDLKRCEHVPLIGPWPSLKRLDLSRMRAVRRIGEEFCGDGDGITCPSLEKLTFEDMPNLEKWHTEPCPCLTKLTIKSCPKLAVQPCIPCSVEKFEITTSNEMLLSAGSLAGLSKLRDLHIGSCGISSSSGHWDGLQYLTALEKLRIKECDELTCLPDDIMYLPSLQALHLVRNRNLRSLEGGGRKQQQSTSTPFFIALHHLNIQEAGMLTALPEWVGGLTPLRSLQIERCSNLAMLPNSLQQLTELQELKISDLPQLAMLPDGLQHLTALQDLSISNLPQLAMLPDGLQYLTALQKLQISDLPQLAMLPDDLQHLTALQELGIFDLPRVAMRAGDRRGLAQDCSNPMQIHPAYQRKKKERK